MTLPLTIAAGGQSTFDVIFTPKTAGALSGSVSVMTDASTAPNTVSRSGTGIGSHGSSHQCTLFQLEFRDHHHRQERRLSVTLTNAGNSSVTASKVTVAGNRLFRSWRFSRVNLAPGQSATLDGNVHSGDYGDREPSGQRHDCQQRFQFAYDHLTRGRGNCTAVCTPRGH